MTSAAIIMLICAVILGTLLSALFSGLETGLYTMNRVRLELRVAAGDRTALILASLIARPRRMLAVILLGNNAANQLGAWSIARMLHGAGMGQLASIVIDTLILVPLLLIVAEVLPKDLFRAHGDRWCHRLAQPLRIFELILTWTGIALLVDWFGWLVSRLVGGNPQPEASARHRMSDLLKEGIDAGVLSSRQTALLDRALQLREHTVEDLMVPWSNVSRLSNEADRSALNTAIQSGWSRLPVVDGNGSVTGILSILDLSSKDQDIRDIELSDPLPLSPHTHADAALRSLRAHHASMAIVRSTNGSPLGMVTIKDLARPLIGPTSHERHAARASAN